MQTDTAAVTLRIAVRGLFLSYTSLLQGVVQNISPSCLHSQPTVHVTCARREFFPSQILDHEYIWTDEPCKGLKTTDHYVV